MTNQEAQIIIGNIPIKPEVSDDCYSIAEYQEAKAMAIKALGSWDEYSTKLWKTAYERGKREALELQSCEEWRRKKMTNEEAIEVINNRDQIMGYCESEKLSDALELAIQVLESQRPTGKWINEKDVGNGNREVRCSNCGAGDEQAWSQKVPYCWKCGAKMEVEE